MWTPFTRLRLALDANTRALVSLSQQLRSGPLSSATTSPRPIPNGPATTSWKKRTAADVTTQDRSAHRRQALLTVLPAYMTDQDPPPPDQVSTGKALTGGFLPMTSASSPTEADSPGRSH